MAIIRKKRATITINGIKIPVTNIVIKTEDMRVFTTWKNENVSPPQVTFLEGNDPPEPEGWELMFAIEAPSYESALLKCRITLGLEADPRR